MPIGHVTAIDSDRHPCKGASTALAGQVLIADGGDVQHWGAVPSATDITLTDNTNLAFQVREGANLYFAANTDNGTELIQIGNSSTRADLVIYPGSAFVSLLDNDAQAFQFLQGANNYLLLETTDAAERITLGNATTNPTLRWLGSGAWSVGGGFGTSGQVLTSAGSGAACTWTSQPYDVATFFPGVPTASQIVARIVFARSVTFPAGLTGSRGDAGTAATASTVFDIQRGTPGSFSSIGSATFALGATVCTFTFASPVTFAAGDVLRILAPATPDATLANISITLAGTR